MDEMEAVKMDLLMKYLDCTQISSNNCTAEIKQFIETPTKTEDGVPIRKLFVSNLAERTTYKDLANLFSKYGNIESCYLQRRHPKSNYAFITFSTTLEAKRARDDHIKLHNKSLRVIPADSWNQPDNAENQYYAAKNSHKSEKKQLNKEQNQVNVTNDVNGPSIDMLNDDCLLYIFRHLPLLDVVSIEKVCKRWEAVSQGLWCTVKKLDLSRPTLRLSSSKQNGISPYEFREILLRCGNHLTEIDLSYCVHHRLNENLLTLIGKLCPNLQTIDVSGHKVSQTNVYSLIVHCHNLVKFTVGFSKHVYEVNLEKLIKVNPKLRFLKIYNRAITGKCLLQLRSETMEELLLEHCSCLQGHDVIEAITKLTNLKTLSLEESAFSAVNCEEMVKITALEKLECLKISQQQFVTDNFLSRLAENCQQLNYIAMNGCEHVTDDGFKTLAKLPKLKTLIMNGLINVTDASIQFMKNLKHVECQGCNLSDNAISELIRRSPQLEYLDLSGCPLITTDTLEKAVATTRCRTNQILKIFVGGTAITYSDYLYTSPFLHIVNVDNRLIEPRLHA